jgi:hypothetical protein
MPREPDVLGQPVSPERRIDHVRHLPYLVPLHSGHWVEVDPQLVRMIQVVGSNWMGMQLQATEIGEPGECRRIAGNYFVRASARGKPEGYDLDPARPGGGGPFLVEMLSLHAVGITHQHVGTAAGAAERPISDGKVVVHQIALGVARFGKEHLVRVGDRDLAAGDAHNLGGGFWHGRSGSGRA